MHTKMPCREYYSFLDRINYLPCRGLNSDQWICRPTSTNPCLLALSLFTIWRTGIGTQTLRNILFSCPFSFYKCNVSLTVAFSVKTRMFKTSCMCRYHVTLKLTLAFKEPYDFTTISQTLIWSSFSLKIIFAQK